MRYEHEKTRRHAENTIAEANRHLDSGKIKKPRHHQMLTNMIKEATETINNLDRMDDARPYSDTNIGYGANPRGRGKTADDAREMVRAAMDAVDRILPHISDDDRYDDDRYDDDDDLKPVDMPRWRSARTGRFLPNLYGPRRVRRVRRRADMDDRYDDRYDRYDDDRYDDDRRMDDARRTAEEARRMADDARRIADDARRTVDDARPAMDRKDRYETRNDDRKPGPDMRR